MYKILGKEETVPLSADPIHYFPIQLHQKSGLTLKCRSTQLFLQLNDKRKQIQTQYTRHFPIYPHEMELGAALSSTDKLLNQLYMFRLF